MVIIFYYKAIIKKFVIKYNISKNLCYYRALKIVLIYDKNKN